MTHTYTPKRHFAHFDNGVRAFERSDEVLDILTDLVTELDQNIGAYIGGKFISLWLGEGEKTEEDAEDLDLLFVNQVDGFIDIVFRQRAGVAVNGGALLPSKTLRLTDEIIEGYRVIIGVAEDGTETRYEVVSGRYTPIVPLPVVSTMSRARRRQMS